MRFEGDGLDESDHLIRFCRNWQLRKDKSAPTYKAFTLRHKKGERDLSFRWLERLCQRASIPVSNQKAIEILQDNFDLDLEEGKGLWAVCNCGRLAQIIQEVAIHWVRVFVVSGQDSTRVKVMWSNWDDLDLSMKVAENIGENLEDFDFYPVTKTILSVSKRRRSG
ncbi:MAG: hypothetical protein OXU36_09440 [Candidatus Poribacteria bacterium]|nr:hypothetical protein [Candidatus Poribacteria bacterium]